MTVDEFYSQRIKMVDGQIANRGILEPRLLAVMKSVPRHKFVSTEDLAWAYADGPLPIGHGQTISQPYIVALMTEMLNLAPAARVLEVGTGSGYQAAVLSLLSAEVHTVEIIPELARAAQESIRDLGYANIHIHLGDGSLGWPEAMPYDGILVAAAAPEVPQPLLDQLSDGGRLVLPVGGRGFQQLEVWERKAQEFIRQRNISVAFVPLRGEHGWK